MAATREDALAEVNRITLEFAEKDAARGRELEGLLLKAARESMRTGQPVYIGLALGKRVYISTGE